MNSIARTLLLTITAGLLVTLSFAGAIAYLGTRHDLQEQFDERLMERAETFAELVMQENDLLELDYEGDLDEESLGALIEVVDLTGAVIARSPDWPTKETDRPVLLAQNSRIGHIRIDDQPAKIATLLHEAALDDDNDPACAIPVQTARTRVILRTESLHEAMASVRAALVTGGVFALLCASICTWLGVRKGLRPLRAMRSQLESIDPRSIEPLRTSPETPRELKPITGAINAALARLRAAMERERRFTDAAAHELRTPIAELRSLTEIAERWPDAERQRTAIAEAKQIASEMEAIIGCLLDSARASANGDSVEPVILGEFVERELKRVRKRAESRGLSLGVSCQNGACWTAPPVAVERIVRNLIDNSIEYTNENGSIEIEVIERPDATEIVIENRPVDIKSEQADHAFEPFWRASAARGERSHIGMGLSIVDTLAASIGVERRVEVTPSRGFRVSLVQRRTR